VTPFALSGLLILITSLSLGIFVLIKTPFNFTNRLWAYFNFAIALWGLGAYKTGEAHDPQSALLWFKIAHIGVITIPIFLLHFTHYFLERKNKNLIIIIYLIGGFFLITLLTNKLMPHVKFMFNSFYYGTNPPLIYYLFCLLWTASVVYDYRLAFIKIKTTSKEKRNKIKYFFLSLSIGYIGGLTNFFPILGINLYPYGNFLVAVFPIVMTFVILKYNLMDINIIIRRSLIYSLLVTTITIIFLITVLMSERLFHQVIHYQNITSSIIMASLIALIFTPLKNRIQDLIDRAFFQATPIEMARQNEQLRQEITQSERMKSIAILASGMAHEIKNPLTPIKTFSEQLPSRLNDKEFLLKFSKIINKEVDRIDSLVQELLNFAKPSPPQLKQVNIHQLIGQTLDLLNNEIIRHKIKLNTSLENKNIIINIDTHQIKQAILNIFLNAIEAMPNGGTLTIATNVIVKPSSSVIASEAKQSFNIEISDTGCGINHKDLPHIFDPFFTKKDHGTGLGLSITHEIIKNHNGKILTESELGKGTTFKIELPL
jgi:signal transduction histidine kinase